VTRRSQLHGLGLNPGEINRVVRAVGAGAGDVVASQINGVTFRSQLSPDIDLTGRQALGQDPAPGGVSELFMQISKPAVYVDTSLGTMRIAPWGEPNMNLYPIFIIGTLVGAGALLGLIVRGLRK
jgi:hypothetical protein